MEITAAILPRRDGPLRVEQVDLGDPQEDEILVRVAACGVCHADSLARHGDLPFPAPGVLGHEGAGVIEALGPGVAELTVGDHVVLAHPACGHCERCLGGEPNYCTDVLELIARGSRVDGTTALRAKDGSPLHSHFFGQSSFATHAIASAQQAVAVPQNLPLEQLAQLGCGVVTGAGAIFNVLRPVAGSSLVVFGVGAVGLSAVMAAVNTPATRIVAIDRHAGRLALAQRLGATDVIDASHADVPSVLREICAGAADYSLECTGNMSVLRQAVDCVGMLGVCGLIGGAPAGARLTLDHFTTLIGKRVVGIHGGEGRPAPLIRALIDLWLLGRFPFDQLTEMFDLDHVEEAVQASLSGEVIKPVLRMPR